MRFSFPHSLLTFLFIALNFFGTNASAQKIGWDVTGYPGAAPVQEAISLVEQDPAGRIMGVVGAGPKLVMTLDNGMHWSFLDLPYSNINGFKFFKGKFFISTALNGIHQSANLSNWEPVLLPNNELNIISLDGNRGFLEIVTKTSRRIYSMNGIDYTLIPDSLGFATESAMTFNGPNEILYISPLGYWKTVPGSNDWVRMGNGMRATGATVIGDSLYFATFHTTNQPLMVMSKLGQELNLDTMFIDGGLQIEMMHTIDDSILLARRGGELHHSFNRKDLSPPFAYPGGEGVRGFSITPNGDYLVSAGFAPFAKIYFSDNYSNSWSRVSRRLEANVATELLSVHSNVLYAATNQGFLIRSDDKGATWITKNDLIDTITMLGWTNPNRLWVGQPGRLLVSSDGGESFIGFDGFSERTPSSMVVGRNGKIYLGTDSGIFISENGGDTWFVPGSQNMHIIYGQKRFPPVLSLSIDSMNRLYVGTTRGIIASLNEGEKYEGGWLSRSPIYAVQTARDGRVYVGSHQVSENDTLRENFYTIHDPFSSGEFWYTPDHSINPWEMNVLNLNSKQQLIAGTLFTWRGGLEWEISELEGVPAPVQVVAQTIDENDIVYISHYDKVYRSSAPKVSSVTRERSAHPIGLYPNPASDILQLDFVGKGTLRLLNTLGEEVLTASVAGSDQISITHLPAGVYFCQLETKEGIHSQSVVISR